VQLSVARAKLLELVVETGDNLDIQDRVDWAEARLIRPTAPQSER
jgi:hypothetical protein